MFHQLKRKDLRTILMDLDRPWGWQSHCSPTQIVWEYYRALRPHAEL
jgi:hypothetical protein